MRPEKQYLIDEINHHLDKGDFVFLTNYERMSVNDIAELRSALAPHGAEFHVIKNRLLNVAINARGLPDVSEYLEGQTAIVLGGENAPDVAKALLKFTKAKDKAQVKGGILSGSTFGPDEMKAISEMPTLPEIQARLLGTLMAPAQKTVNILVAPARDMIRVINAYKKKQEEGSEAA